jgi:hypothetical protein
MRFSLASIAAVLPVLASAQDAGADGDYVAQFQNFLGNLGSKIPHTGIHDPVAALEAKLGSMRLHVLTKENWWDTLMEGVTPQTVSPSEWWVLLSGRNTTCGGRCGQLDQAFNETAAKFALSPGSPKMGYLNCDDQPLLCSSWMIGAGHIWAIDVLPNPEEVNIYKHRFNVTLATSDEMVSLRVPDKAADERWTEVDSYFHPFKGQVSKLGLGMPFAYILWFFNIFPNWLFMLVVSFASRSMMSRRMAPN